MRTMYRCRIPVLALILMFFVLSTVASAADMWPGWWKSKGKVTQHGNTVTGNGNQTYSVAEPAAILLLGAGLVSLGIYAKRKRGKKQ